MYILAVAEVVRRRSFSSQFQKVKIHTELLYVHKYFCIFLKLNFQDLVNPFVNNFFFQWASKLCKSSLEARTEETAQREEFELLFG